MRSPENAPVGISANDETSLFGNNLRSRVQWVGGEQGYLRRTTRYESAAAS